MRQSKVEIFVHLVWATKGRMARLTAEYERRVHRCVVSEAEQCGCDVLAIGGMPDHVHLLARIPSRLSVSTLAKQVKGVSSSLMNDMRPNDMRPEFSEPFRWQSGYACFSVGRDQVDQIIHYVQNQRLHHAQGTVWSEWEKTDEEVQPEVADA